jgi:hypothetical protein
VRLLSIRHHAIALTHELHERRFGPVEHLSLEGVIATSILVLTGFLLLSIRHLRGMDVP